MTPTPSSYRPRHQGAAQTPSQPAKHTGSAQATEQNTNDDAPAHVPRSGMAAASTLMAAGTTVSRVLGFVRTALLGIAIGATTTMADVFEKANSIPNIIYVLLAGGMFNVVLVSSSRPPKPATRAPTTPPGC